MGGGGDQMFCWNARSWILMCLQESCRLSEGQPRAVHCNPSAKREQDGDDVNINRVTSCMHTPHAHGREVLVLNWIQVVVPRLPCGDICLEGQVS